MSNRETKVSEGLMQHLDMSDASQVSADKAKRLREERHHERVAARAAVEDYEAALASHGTASGGGEVNETVIDALVKADCRGDAASEQAEQLDLPRGRERAGGGKLAQPERGITVRDVRGSPSVPPSRITRPRSPHAARPAGAAKSMRPS